jgi:hypothetical protein
MSRRWQQAIFMCNGLFTGHRTLENVFAQELAFLPRPIGTPSGGDYQINEARQGFDRWELTREILKAIDQPTNNN